MSRNNNEQNSTRKNNDIRVRQVLLIDQDGNKLGVKDIQEALRLAREAGMDLVEIAPSSRPPVCKIMDYSKYAYQKSKRDRANKQKKKVTKTLNFKYKIDDHDLEIKIKQAIGFLQKGSDVKMEMRFRGRESLHTDRMIEKMSEVAAALSAEGVCSAPQVENRSVSFVVNSKH